MPIGRQCHIHTPVANLSSGKWAVLETALSPPSPTNYIGKIVTTMSGERRRLKGATSIQAWCATPGTHLCCHTCNLSMVKTQSTPTMKRAAHCCPGWPCVLDILLCQCGCLPSVWTVGAAGLPEAAQSAAGRPACGGELALSHNFKCMLVTHLAHDVSQCEDLR